MCLASGPASKLNLAFVSSGNVRDLEFEASTYLGGRLVRALQTPDVQSLNISIDISICRLELLI